MKIYYDCILHFTEIYDRVQMYPPETVFGQPEVRAIAPKKVQYELTGEPSCFLFIGGKRYNYTDMGGVIR